MKVLIVGGGGREHALAWKVAQAPQVTQVYVAPGNAGTAQEPGCVNVPITADMVDELCIFATAQAIDLTIVGPEAPLALGIVDRFRALGLACFGPTRAAAQLEASKGFCKDFLARHQIPTATYRSFEDLSAAVAYLQNQPMPIVIKADGLAAGKGVVIAQRLDEALAAVHAMLAGNAYGSAGARVVIEEFLPGEEVSYIVLADGTHTLPLATTQDHKRLLDRDLGPNTGGMGAYSPAPLVTPALEARILAEVITPTIRAMAAEGTPYTGFLYAGLMITPNGDPKVLEFNCRLGDPETQPLLMRLRTDLVELCTAALSGRLDTITAEWDPRPSLCVVMVAAGYPERYPRGEVIGGLPTHTESSFKVFHAGTAARDGNIVTDGGRVLGITTLGDDLAVAQQRAYAAAATIHWEHQYYRRDIGFRALPYGPHQ